ncbi:MFS transporter [Streptomyces flavofungini]|uniref:MFS transporter n=1 Tax=Streptomyces flavofungini TaxID=68200 RepID=UPI0025B0C28E|nr:MFS transporter [Streptomyces flavofungini]WJV46128.1 MFS transporter [Streptomyces flavofungini]
MTDGHGAGAAGADTTAGGDGGDGTPGAERLAGSDERGPRDGYGRVFAVAEFRAVFVAHALSLLGVVVSEIALTVLVYDLTGSPLLSALAFALGMLPYLVGGTLFAGVADRYPPRRVLVGCDLVCAGCAALMALPVTPVAGLLALRCLIAAVSPVFNGTRMATLTDVLGDGDLFVLGRSLLRMVSQSAVLVGFGLGGVLLTVVSPRGALVITLVTFLASALLLRAGTKRRPARGGERGSGGAGEGETALLRYSLAGAREVLGHRRMRALLLLLWAPPMFVVAPEALAAPYAEQIGVGTAGVGLLMCAMPVGTIAAEVYAGSALTPATRSRIVLPLAATTLLPLLAYVFAPGLAWALPALVLAGAGSAYTLGLDRWFVDAVPPELRGRAMTVHTAGLMTLQGVGMALAGLAAEFFAVSTVVAGAGALGTVCCLLLVREVRSTGRPGASALPNPETGADRYVTGG